MYNIDCRKCVYWCKETKEWPYSCLLDLYGIKYSYIIQIGDDR